MAYRVGYPPGIAGTQPPGRLSLPGKTGDTGDGGDELASSDAYAERMQDAVTKINRRDYPEGMIAWLKEASPRLYAELTDRMPNEIHRLWSEHGPLDQFEQVVNRWLETHREACALYQVQLRTCQNRNGKRTTEPGMEDQP